MAKKKRAEPQKPPGKLDYRLAVLKGLVERGDGRAYFGSTLAYSHHLQCARDAGLVAPGSEEVTGLGSDFYHLLGLAALPHEGRAYMWDWSAVEVLPFSDARHTVHETHARWYWGTFVCRGPLGLQAVYSGPIPINRAPTIDDAGGAEEVQFAGTVTFVADDGRAWSLRDPHDRPQQLLEAAA